MPRRDTPKPGPTEAVNPRTRDLDTLSADGVLGHILDEDATVAEAVRKTRPQLVRACALLRARLERGGRWINLGAGTSGRIGVLDAAEIPPTFGLDPARVCGVIAGGERALSGAVEGAEDDGDAAISDLDRIGFGPDDALVCLSASGRTPYAVAGARHARALGAGSIAITCAPDSELAHAVAISIVAQVGPEVLAGSTRMKGGLAQKMILHALSTTVMVGLGHVRGNRMTALQAVNAKLRARALQIVIDLASVDRESAEQALCACNGSVARALDHLAANKPS